MDSIALSSRAALEYGSAALVLYLVALGTYRLFLSPIASIPGPKLAALTQWYETYYEFKGPGGQFLFHYRRLHEKYGPIVRISPREVHIQDARFFHSMYSQKLAWDKPAYLQHRFGSGEGLTWVPSHQTHRARRTAVNPFFSKRAINDFSPALQLLMDKLCNRVDTEFRGTGKVLRVDHMFACFSADTVMEYCFEDTNYLDAPDFYCDLAEAMNALLESTHIVTQFPWAASIIHGLPKSLLAKLSPEVRVAYNFELEMTRQVAQVLKDGRQDQKNAAKHKTIFKALLDSDLPPEDLSSTRLTHEALTIVGAGVETVRYALSVATLHILSNSEIHGRLQKELFTAIPDPKEMPSLEELERLPYLDACIHEGLRLSYGTSQRGHRTSNTISLQYGSYTIPPGTIVSMDNYSVAHDEQIFPDSYSFIPERWLDNSQAPDGKPLKAYMVSFGRGTRQCLGMPLAFAEMYIVLANLFRKFELELYKTDRTAVDMFSDTFAPRPKAGTSGVRVLVK